MQQPESSYRALLTREHVIPLIVLLGGVLLHSMNVLLTATVLPSVVVEIGGAHLMSWPSTAFLASSIVAATCAGVLTAVVGARRAFCAGGIVFCAGALTIALAPSMAVVIAGRFVQGFGGGLLAALAYVLVRNVFPQSLWTRVFALISAVWGISVLIGPLIGGVFATSGTWRGAFFTVAAIAGTLAAVTFRVLPADVAGGDKAVPRPPILRVALVCVAIGVLSYASVAPSPFTKGVCIVLAIGAVALTLWLDRAAAMPLLPRDAFSVSSVTGVGLWMVLLLSLAYSSPPVFGPLLLQTLHGLDPLGAGYMIAVGSLAWTVGSIWVATLSSRWVPSMILVGPLTMAAGLVGLAVLLPRGPVWAINAPLTLLGLGIGFCWAFVAQRTIGAAKEGEGDVAASSVPTVQQAGFAFGAAIAGLAANASGLSDALERGSIVLAAFTVPASFVAIALVAAVMALRLNALARRSLA